MKKPLTKREKKLLKVLKANPGIDAIRLKELGVPTRCGIVRHAELIGLIRWDNGWYVVD